MTTWYLIRDLVWHKSLYRSPCGLNKKKLGYYVVLGWISQLGWTKVLDFVCTAFFKFSIEAFHCIVCLARAVALIEELIYTFCYYFFFTVSVAGWLCLVLMGSQNDEEEEEKLEKMHLALLKSGLIKEHQYGRGLMEWFWRPQNRIYIPSLCSYDSIERPRYVDFYCHYDWFTPAWKCIYMKLLLLISILYRLT